MLNTIIGIAALLVAVGSYFYTWHFNHYSVEILETTVEKIHNQNKINFQIVNLSTRPILLQDMKLKYKGHTVKDNGFNLREFEENERLIKSKEWQEENSISVLGNTFSSGLNPYIVESTNFLDESNNFESPTFIKSGDSEWFSYFVDDIPDEIQVSAKQRISYFKHSKSFSVHFDKQE